MIVYTDALSTIEATHLKGFFVGWGNPPDADTHLRILHGSYKVWLALESESGQVVGFINAISDGVLAAFIPLLEVLPAYQGQGIGKELAQRMLASLGDLYAVDLICDSDVQPFYEKLGMHPYSAMIQRNYHAQSGKRNE
jgi:ribosomal protein S18 acetylase RimI-like enzyme